MHKGPVFLFLPGEDGPLLREGSISHDRGALAAPVTRAAWSAKCGRDQLMVRYRLSR
jgi:hypothetical protein